MKLLTYLSSVGLQLLTRIVQRVPLGVALWWGKLLGIFAYYVVPKRRRISLENLQNAFKDRPLSELHRIVRRMAKNLGQNIMEFLRLPVLKLRDIDLLIEFRGLDHLEKALAQGKGVFLLSAHFGNWELFAAVLALKGYPISLIAKYLSSRLLNTLLQDYRRRTKINILYREKSLNEIVRRLKMNEIIGFVLDQNTKREEGVFVKFFGRPAATIPSLAVLTQRLGTPVVPGFIIRQKEGQHRIEFLPPVEFQRQASLKASILHNTQLYTNIIEDYVRRYPDQWIWLHRRWKTQPK